jgi:hypothetical protein
MNTNIKNLPEGKYFTEIMWSDQHAWREVKRTAKTVTVAAVEVEYDPEWTAKRKFLPGGFCGHVPNQGEQTWLFKRVNEEVTRTLRLTKRGWALKGTRYVEDRATEYYDYNF